MGLFNIFHKKEEFNYWQFQRELDIQHDKMVEEFAQRDRDHDQFRREVDIVSKESMKCFQIISVLSKKGFISSDIWVDYLRQEGWTAYLPIEVGSIIKRIRDEGDALTLYELYKNSYVL